MKDHEQHIQEKKIKGRLQGDIGDFKAITEKIGHVKADDVFDVPNNSAGVLAYVNALTDHSAIEICTRL